MPILIPFTSLEISIVASNNPLHTRRQGLATPNNKVAHSKESV